MYGRDGRGVCCVPRFVRAAGGGRGGGVGVERDHVFHVCTRGFKRCFDESKHENAFGTRD